MSKRFFWVLIAASALLACSHQPRWAMMEMDSGGGIGGSGIIEYNGVGGTGRRIVANGIGGSGRTAIDEQDSPANGIGGSGKQPTNDSLALNQPVDNGIGGSGKSAILGEITAFGSIYVNDKHILLPEQTQYLNGDRPASQSDLQLGQVVAVLADVLGDDYLANEVHLLNHVAGPLHIPTTQPVASDKTRVPWTVLGQRLIPQSSTRIVDTQGRRLDVNELKSGQWVSVSGFRSPDQSIRVTLMQVQANTRNSSAVRSQSLLLAGPVSQIDGQYWLDQQRLSFSAPLPHFDEPLRMEGHLDRDIFVVDQWQPLPHTRFFELADEIWLEGFPTPDADLFIDGFEVQLPQMDDFIMEETFRIGIDMDDREMWMQPPDHFYDEPMMDGQWRTLNDVEHFNDEPDHWSPEPDGDWHADPGGHWNDEWHEHDDWHPPEQGADEWWEEPQDFKDPPPPRQP